MNRNIRVKGRGKLSVKPDTICLSLEAEGTFPEYEKTIKESARQTKILREALESSGLKGEDLKTRHFSIDTEYESYEDHNRNYQKRFVGYSFHHDASILFPNDNEQLGRTLYALSHCPIIVEFSIRYTVKDPEAVKSELLKKAVEDSSNKAKLLCRAAGVKLGDIQNIDYSWGELEIYSEPLNRMVAMPMLSALPSSSSYDIDIEADDIEVNDTVTIEWEIL